MNDDQDLTAALRSAARTDYEVPEGGDRLARRSARRRSAAAVTGAAGLLAAVVVGVPLAVSQQQQTDAAPVPMATQPTTPSEQPTSGPAPTAPATSGPTAVPSVTAVTGTATGTAPDSGTATGGLTLEPDGEGPVAAGTLSGLRVRGLEPGGTYLTEPGSVVDRGPVTWLLDPCRDGGPSGDERRTGFFSAVVAGGDSGLGFQAATYDDAAAAAEALDELVAEVERCGDEHDDQVWSGWDRLDDDAAGGSRVVTYDVAVGQGSAGPQWGGLHHVLLVGDALVATTRSGLYVGTDIAHGLGDERPEVGPADRADGGDQTDALFAPVDRAARSLGDDVAAHLGVAPAGDGQEAPDQPVTESSGPELPEEVLAVHGGRYWAVFLAVAYEGSDPRLAEAQQRLQELGYEGGVGDVACSQGAAEALGLDPDRYYVGSSVLFADRQDAQRFVDGFEPGVVGTAEVTTYCLD